MAERTSLTEPVQAFIVERLAMFATPSRVAELVKEMFGVKVSRQQVYHYDPDRPNARVAEKWRTLHATTRKALIDEQTKAPIAHRGVRLHLLQQMIEAAIAAGDFELAGKLLEQSAKETGDFFTNRRVLTPEDPAEALARELGIPAEQLRALAAGTAGATTDPDAGADA